MIRPPTILTSTPKMNILLVTVVFGAVALTQVKGGTLAAINTRPELEWVKNQARDLDRGDFWLGGNDIRKEGHFVWNPYNTLVNRDCTDWDEGQPDNARGNQDCMVLWAAKDFRWDDSNCDLAKSYICETFEKSEDVCSCKV